MCSKKIESLCLGTDLLDLGLKFLSFMAFLQYIERGKEIKSLNRERQMSVVVSEFLCLLSGPKALPCL